MLGADAVEMAWLGGDHDFERHIWVHRAGEVVRTWHPPRRSLVDAVRLHEMPAEHRHTGRGADDVAAAPGADHVDEVRVVHQHEPFTAVDRHHRLREVGTSHADSTGRRRLWAVAEDRYEQAG